MKLGIFLSLKWQKQSLCRLRMQSPVRVQKKMKFELWIYIMLLIIKLNLFVPVLRNRHVFTLLILPSQRCLLSWISISFKGPITWKWIYNVLFVENLKFNFPMFFFFLFFPSNVRFVSIGETKISNPNLGFQRWVLWKYFLLCTSLHDCSFFFIHANDL